MGLLVHCSPNPPSVNSKQPESVTPVRDELLAFQAQPFIEPQKTDTNTDAQDKLLLEKLTNTFKNLFGYTLTPNDALAIFAHSSWPLLDEGGRETILTNRLRYETVGRFAVDLLILKQILTASRERTVIGELGAKQKVIKTSGWFAINCQRLGLGKPLLGKSAEREFTDPKISLRIVSDMAFRIFGWLGLKTGIEGFFAASDSYFDLTEEFPFDVMSDADYKGKFQEYTQSKNHTQPQYSIIARQGTEHVGLLRIDGRRIG
jgi:dsRNA-specific ribonuclease